MVTNSCNNLGRNGQRNLSLIISDHKAKLKKLRAVIHFCWFDKDFKVDNQLLGYVE